MYLPLYQSSNFQVLTESDGFDLFNTDTRQQTKKGYNKISPLTVDILSASVDRPILSCKTHQCYFYILVQEYILHPVYDYILQQNIKSISHMLITYMQLATDTQSSLPLVQCSSEISKPKVDFFRSFCESVKKRLGRSRS